MTSNFKSVAYAAIFAISSVISTQAVATIIDTDQNSFIDTATGIEWMDFGINNHHSFDYVVSQLDGGEYDGWALATVDQAYGLYTALTGSTGREGREKTLRSDKDAISDMDAINEMIGINEKVDVGWGSHDHSFGMFNGVNGLSYLYHQTIDYSSSQTDQTFVIINQLTDISGYGASTDELYSTLLVRQEVPEPTTLAIFALGIMGLSLRRFNKQA